MDAEELIVKDSNGNVLKTGDAVTVIKDLKVSGSFTIKRGTVIKNIHLVEGDTKNIEGKVEKIMMIIKTEFVKKVF